MIRWIQKKFNDWWWKKHPPEMVKYDDVARGMILSTKDGLKMRIEGEKYLYPGFPRGHVLTSDYYFTDFSKLKHGIKNNIFNYIWYELEKGRDKNEIREEVIENWKEIYEIMKKLKYDVLPMHKCCRAVRELSKGNCEGVFKQIVEVMCFIFQEDDAYRFRFQWIKNYFKNDIKSFENALIQMENAETSDDMKGRVRLWRRGIMFLLEDERVRKNFETWIKSLNWRKLKLSKEDKYYFRRKYFKCDFPVYSY